MPPTDASGSGGARLGEVLAEILQAEERGEKPDLERYTASFPELEGPLRAYFRDREAFKRLSPGPRPTESAEAAPSSVDSGATQDEDARPGGQWPPLRAGGRFGGYEIVAELGRGGMGVVYQARQLALNRVVALKMILAADHADERGLARFRAEAEAVARLQHPNIVQVFEISEHEGKPFFSMEFCPGGGLDKKLNAGPLEPSEAARLVETLARAVRAAHDKGVIHRDLKPANVLLAEDGTPKVTDFGLAKRMDADAAQTRSGDLLGTPSYMAPEQAGGDTKSVGPATDVYALGAILYECLTGRPPFKGPTTLDTLTQVLADDPLPPRQLQPKTPRDLETICLKCLEKQRPRRYWTAAALADDLGRWRRGEPVRAQPPSLGYVLQKKVRRYRTPLIVAAAMLLLLAAVVTTAFVLLLGAWGTEQKNFEAADKNGKDLQKTRDSLSRQLSTSASIAAGHSDADYRAATCATASTGCCTPTSWRRLRIPCARLTSA